MASAASRKLLKEQPSENGMENILQRPTGNTDAKDGDEARGRLLKNISASGCALEFVNPMGKVEHPFKVDQILEL
ncbi:MAG: hypothetical protein QF450_12065 [Rhodospirillales bacterium]|jgi:hypothetical protein|nr:hypothetical protein [Rhodospirillales bacterium]HJO72058.1 hypothetical protein [Rhodospirillales bacterium]